MGTLFVLSLSSQWSLDGVARTVLHTFVLVLTIPALELMFVVSF